MRLPVLALLLCLLPLLPMNVAAEGNAQSQPDFELFPMFDLLARQAALDPNVDVDPDVVRMQKDEQAPHLMVLLDRDLLRDSSTCPPMSAHWRNFWQSGYVGVRPGLVLNDEDTSPLLAEDGPYIDNFRLGTVIRESWTDPRWDGELLTRGAGKEAPLAFRKMSLIAAGHVWKGQVEQIQIGGEGVDTRCVVGEWQVPVEIRMTAVERRQAFAIVRMMPKPVAGYELLFRLTKDPQGRWVPDGAWICGMY